MCIQMCVYTGTCAYVYIYTYIYTHVYICIYIYVYIDPMGSWGVPTVPGGSRGLSGLPWEVPGRASPGEPRAVEGPPQQVLIQNIEY